VISAPIFNRLIDPPGTKGPAPVVAAARQLYGELVDYREGATATVSVRRAGDQLWLQVDGVPEAASHPSIQNFVAQVPMIFHGQARRVLVVGLGSGGTLASVLRWPVEHVDVVEISPEVRDVARRWFAPSTGRPLDDPRVHLLIGDGRNHLRYGRQLYDVIVSQPSRPWAAGSSGLFTREYFAEMRDHLAPGGVACAWFWGNAVQLGRPVVRAWHEVFPATYAFGFQGEETVLIAFRDGGTLDPARVARAMAAPAVRDDLARLGFRQPGDLMAAAVAGPDGVARFADGVPPNTDDNAYVEFASRGGLLVLARTREPGFAGAVADPARR
jgi:spermidine synthase